MKKYILLLFMLGAIMMHAQSDNVQKDIEIAENILASMLKQKLKNQSWVFPSTFDITGSYSRDYGVVFRVGSNHNGFAAVLNDGARELRNVIIYDDNGKLYNHRKDENDHEADHENEIEGEIEMRDLVEDACREFLTDYGHLIRGLDSDQNISILVGPKRNSNNFFVHSKGPKIAGQNHHINMSISVGVADIQQFREGSIDENEFNELIEVEEIDEDEFVREDLELMSTIFNRLYQKDLTDSYFIATDPRLYYEQIPKIGVTYYMKVYSSHNYSGGYSIPSLKLKKLGLTERNERVEELYPQFLDGLKENILEYGRVLKSVEGGEKLTFVVTLTQCEPCDIPDVIELSIAADVLKDYDNNKLSLAEAVKKFDLLEREK